MKTIIDILKIYYKSCLDFLFPRYCLICNRVNHTGLYEHICDECADEELHLIKTSRCTRCGYPIIADDIPNVKSCPDCVNKPLTFKSAYSITVFAGAARQIVHELKYRGGSFITRDIETIFRQFPESEDYFRDAILVPTPIHFYRRFQRRYNQSELLLKIILKVFPDSNAKPLNLLKRNQKLKTQTRLSRELRRKNIRNAFAINDTKLIETLNKNSRIVIIDDVMTTGSTLSECTRILKRAGFTDIHVFTFSKRL